MIVTVCTAFALSVSEAKTEIMCLRTREMPNVTATFSVEVAGQVYKQTHEFVDLGGNVNHHADLSIEVIRNAWCIFRKYSLELYDRPSAPLELKIRMLKAEVLETMLYGCVTWSPRASHYDALGLHVTQPYSIVSSTSAFSIRILSSRGALGRSYSSR